MTNFEKGFSDGIFAFAKYAQDRGPETSYGFSMHADRGGMARLGMGIGAAGGLASSIIPLLMAGTGAGIGALLAPRDKDTGKKKRAKAALIGALLGIPVISTAGGAYAGGYGGSRLADAINAIGNSGGSQAE